MEDPNSPEAVAQRATQEDPIVMYLIVRESLGMSIGKTAAQCAHASQMLLLKRDELLGKIDWVAHAHDAKNYNDLFERACTFNNWLNSSFRKVVLKADDKEWAKLKEEFKDDVRVLVVDAGLTELNPNTETVIGLFPMKKSERPKLLTKLQTLK